MLRNDHPPGALGVDAVAAEDPYCLLGEPAKKLAAVLDFRFGFGQRFPHLECHQQRDLVLALLDQIKCAAQNLRSIAWWGLSPVRRRFDCGIECCSAVIDARVSNGLYRLAGRGVVHLQGGTRGGPAPFAADEQPLRYRFQQRRFSRVQHREASLAQPTPSSTRA